MILDFINIDLQINNWYLLFFSSHDGFLIIRKKTNERHSDIMMEKNGVPGGSHRPPHVTDNLNLGNV
jgi:hypothetical protein